MFFPFPYSISCLHVISNTISDTISITVNSIHKAAYDPITTMHGSSLPSAENTKSNPPHMTDKPIYNRSYMHKSCPSYVKNSKHKLIVNTKHGSQLNAEYCSIPSPTFLADHCIFFPAAQSSSSNFIAWISA